MTPEQLKKGKEIQSEIENQSRPLDHVERNTPYYNGVTLACLNNSTFSSSFRLKPEQIDMVKILVVTMAEKNLEELKSEFEDL